MDIGNVSTTPSGQVNKYVGENLTLECSVSISPYPLPSSVPFPMFEWLFGPNNATPPMGVQASEVRNNSDIYVSTLEFFPLQESHQGNYKCRVGNNTILTTSVEVSTCMYNKLDYTMCIFIYVIWCDLYFYFSDPVQVTISDDGTVPSVGQNYTLTCNIINVTININTYIWQKDGETLAGKQERCLTLPLLNLSSAGEYTCEVVVVSTPYRSEIKPIYLHSEYTKNTSKQESNYISV